MPSLRRAFPKTPLSPPPATADSLADRLLSLSASRSLPQGQQLHAHILKSGYIAAPPSDSGGSVFTPPPARRLWNYLITFYARCGVPFLSRTAFDDSPAPRPPAAWSALLAAFAQNDQPFLALSIFRDSLAAAVAPSDRSLPSAAKAAAALSDPSLSRSLHAIALKAHLSGDVFVSSALVDAYAKSSLLHDARCLFDQMPNKNVVSWSAMIYGYSEAALHEDALKLFKLAFAELGPGGANDFTYSCVVRVCSTATLLELGSAVHSLCFKSSFDSSPFVGSSLISLYSKCGLVQEAYKLFNEMPNRNIGAWNSVLIASAQHGHTDAAFKRFQDMRTSGFCPNSITFLCLLTACSHAGLVDEGKQYFDMMSVNGIEASSMHYAAMVDLLSRAGHIREAVALVDSMPVEPTESIWSAIITGCRIHKDPDTASYAASKLFEAGSLSSGAHMLLSNAYAASGRYTDAAQARKAMRDRGVRKETGLSWLEARGKVHTFVSGDRLHKRSEEIYQVLAEVGEKMEKAGYVPDTNQVLRDVDGEQKLEAIWYHSERLAIGLGLLLVPEGQPIRVMKNLRVCNDCHTAIKYLSKCTDRTIILRDNNRFHRFEDGSCSCGDYW